VPRTSIKLAGVVLAAGLAAAACGTVKMGSAAILGDQRITSSTLSAQVSDLNTSYQANKPKVQLQFPAQINVGSDGGKLEISGSRKDTTVNTMDAFQAGVSGVVGSLQYNFDPSHQHWHYLALDRYDLRTHDTSLTLVARDQKTGFCLVQSSAINPTDCQKNNPNVVGNQAVVETINPGFNDIYDPAKDGQYIDVTGLNGTYEFIQWVNADCRLSDTGPGGHTWATVLNINATAATPTVTVTSQTPLWNNYYAGLSNAQKCLPAETVRPVVSE